MAMKISIKGILEGAWNSIFIKEEIEKVANERQEICKGCSMNSDHAKRFNKYKTFRPDYHCVSCGCNIIMKTRSMAEHCPLDKWPAQMSKEEEEELTKKLEKDGSTDGKNR